MGWFGGLFGSRDEQDPLRKLDPKLREFLEKESPVKFRHAGGDHEPVTNAAPGRQQQQQQPPPPPPPVASGAPRAPTAAVDDKPPAPPAESLYPDGRYAHLWRTYRPLASVEAETKSDHERLMDVLEGYKERKASIGRAALENCALEQVDWSDCMRSGDVVSRMTMCRAEIKKFERCYMVQSRLLKALGYLSTYDRPAHVEEDIQMHADSLYQKMTAQEAAIDAAKAEGRPIPKFPPLFSRQQQAAQAAARAAEAAAGGDDDDLAALNPEARRQWLERLEKVPEHDRESELEAMRAELRAKVEIKSRLEEFRQEKEEERRARKAEGRETVSDKVSSLFGK